MANNREQLLNQLSDPAAKTKIAAKFGGYVRDRLRESSFAEAVLPPDNIDRSQCQVSTNHDALVKIDETHRRNAGMSAERIHDFRAAMNDAEYAFRQAAHVD